MINNEPGAGAEIDLAERSWRIVRVLLPNPLFGTGELVTRGVAAHAGNTRRGNSSGVDSSPAPEGDAVVGRQSVTLSSVEELNVDVRDDPVESEKESSNNWAW